MSKTIKIFFENLRSKEYERVEEFVFGKRYLVVIQKNTELDLHLHILNDVKEVAIQTKFGDYKPVLLPKKEANNGI